MKKFNKLFSIISSAIVFLICGCSNVKVEEISYDKFDSLIKNSESFILYIGSASCHNCTEFGPKFEEVIKENNIKNVYYIDLDGLSDEDRKNFNRTINVTGTPTVVFINDGEEESSFNRINGSVSKEKIVQRLKANDYIK